MSFNCKQLVFWKVFILLLYVTFHHLLTLDQPNFNFQEAFYHPLTAEQLEKVHDYNFDHPGKELMFEVSN